MDVKVLNDCDNMVIVNIPVSKTKKRPTFIVFNETISEVSFLASYQTYENSRQPKKPHSRFFVNYFNGKSPVDVIGKNTMAKIPYKIATFLKLKNPQNYTGHCFRRASATLHVNVGGDLVTLGGWESSKIAEGYVAESLIKKRGVASQIITGQQFNSISNSSKDQADNFTTEVVASLENNLVSKHNMSIKVNQQSSKKDVKKRSEFSGNIVFHKLENCTINISR